MERLSSNSTAATITASAGNPFSPSAPFTAAADPIASYSSTLTEGALAKAPAPESALSVSSAPTMEAMRRAIGCALVDAGHSSAAQLLGSGDWTLDGAGLRIDVPTMGKKMLALTVNTAAEKIIRQELQRAGAPTRFLVVPGDRNAMVPHSAVSEAGPMVGGIHQTALANPLVQQATKIFKAEVRSVVDLRQK